MNIKYRFFVKNIVLLFLLKNRFHFKYFTFLIKISFFNFNFEYSDSKIELICKSLINKISKEMLKQL